MSHLTFTHKGIGVYFKRPYPVYGKFDIKKK